MEKEIYSQRVDKRSAAEMTEYLNNHTRYMGEYYAHNIRLSHLCIPHRLRDTAEEVVFNAENAHYVWWQYRVPELLAEFREDAVGISYMATGYYLSFLGRSGGWAVLCPPDNYVPVPCHSDKPWPIKELQFYTRLVQLFDRATDRMRLDFLRYCEELL